MANEDTVWEVLSHVFPGDSKDYEHEYPYVIEYTAEGQRRTKKLSKSEIDEIRKFNGLPSEVIVNEEGEEVKDD